MRQKRFSITKIKGGVTAPKGFLANGIYCGIKKNHPGRIKKDRPKDLALIYSQEPARAVGFFTTNQIQAAPLEVCKNHLKKGVVRAVVINSGNANCCTGKQGLDAARRISAEVARRLGLKKTEVLPGSTGIIGRQLPVNKICNALDDLVSGLSSGPQAETRAAQAIMTTDTKKKETAVRVKIGPQTVTIGGMAKGSGMIAPNLATMLCFVTTDACISPGALHKAGQQAVEESFNNITVDGDMSTNDTVLIMANGLAGNRTIKYNSAGYRVFSSALKTVCCPLARMIAADGEGARKLIEITAKGARTKKEARQLALAIANSSLVKTMVAGSDPNWGRIVAAVGASRVRFDPDRIQIYIGDYCVFKNGQGQDMSSDISSKMRRLRKELSVRQVHITLDLKSGQAEAKVFTCDLTEEYVRINAKYST